MLTKSDVKIIGNLFDKKFDEKFDKKFDEKIDKKFDEKLKPIHDDIKTIKKDVRKIKKDLDTHIDLTDKWIIYHDKRIQKLESRLEIKTPEFAGS